MLDIKTIDFTDFSFNGIYLSSLDAFVGGREAFKTFSALPSREITTERLIGVDSEIVVATRLNPRTFTIPIFINDLSYGALRNLSVWLDAESPKVFFWRDDTVYIKCMLDTGGIDIENIFDTSGLTELKFIAHDPFFYEITPTELTKVLTAPSDNIEIENLGNKSSFPKLKVTGSGDITIKSFNSANNELTTCTIHDIVDHIYIDSLEKRVYSISGQTLTNFITNFEGTFPIIDTGDVKITISGTVTNIDVTPRFRWI